ncbi:transforming acidic coiled-coil-containing protein 3-like [Temnothorax nylanderi]|uniref:transforming acidic coiled-coil-containing protein 3-like n=1 Tax=Temnothorax nylanderi TaxID=102681 RepID=UPI003A8C7D7B
MLPQGNTQTINEEKNGKSESPLPDVGTPKRNPAIAAIDMLLFYSRLPNATVQKSEKAQEKNEQPAEEPKSDAPLIDHIDMSKELELVRTTVLQLEEELEKQKKEHEAELERQKAEFKRQKAFQEKINKLQAQMYDQLKEHAMTQLEKANLELDIIRKQNEVETVKLHAMIRKAELKSNSLAELLEQKTKENKELEKILDEVIARVGHGNSE